jgi:hypothetical protein
VEIGGELEVIGNESILFFYHSASGQKDEDIEKMYLYDRKEWKDKESITLYSSQTGNNTTTINKRNIVEFEFGTYCNNIIDKDFLRECTSLTAPPIISNFVTSVGSYFLSSCTSLTAFPIIQNSVTSVGDSFLYNCTSLTAPPIIPNSVTSVGSYFLYRTKFSGSD